MTERSIQIEGHTFTAKEYNSHIDSIPIICIHGVTGTYHEWEYIQIPLIEEQYRWYALSLLGHHPSAVMPNFKAKHLTPQFVGRIHAKAIRQLVGDSPVILFGYSAGAFTSLCIAHEDPDLVQRMILLSGFVTGKWGSSMRLLQVLAHFPKMGKKLFITGANLARSLSDIAERRIKTYVDDLFATRQHHNYEALIKRTQANMVHVQPFGWYIWFYQMPDTDIIAWLPHIKQETLIIHGTVDKIVYPRQARIMHEHLTNSQLCWLEGSGHVPYLERPDALAQYIVSFLS